VSRERTSCSGCGAVLASDQEYCLACGARRVPTARERWRRPLIAAALTLIAGITVAVVLYIDARSQADDTAAPRSGVSRKAPPSGGQGGGAGSQQPQAGRSAAGSSR
jgi:hypothetical protein